MVFTVSHTHMPVYRHRAQVEAQYCRDVSEALCFLLLPKDDFNERTTRYFLREMLASRRAVLFVGWGFFLVSLGGQTPHVLRAPMWALNTRGEPNEIELTVRVLTDDFTASFSRPSDSF